jgi:hypothetical protein
VLFCKTHLANMLQKNQASNPKATHRNHIRRVFCKTHLANMLQKNQASNPKATHRNPGGRKSSVFGYGPPFPKITKFLQCKFTLKKLVIFGNGGPYPKSTRLATGCRNHLRRVVF